MKRICILAMLVLGNLAIAAQTATGDWHGAVEVGSVRLSLVIHLGNGSLAALMDSPDQHALGIPAIILKNRDGELAISVPQIGGSFTGTFCDSDTIAGVFAQHGATLPLRLARGAMERRRPQTPVHPFPYAEEEITFSTPDGATHAGTLTKAESTDAPTVVMVSGSGQQNRDEELFGHRPFAVVADHLARNGIASLRYDDRGIGGSDGLRPDLTTDDFRHDALAAIAMLRQTGRATGRIGILGHSEGGLIAFMIAGEQPEAVDFIATLAGPAVTGREILAEQISDEAARKGTPLDPIAVSGHIDEACAASPWMKWFTEYDPALAIATITCPVFALFGEKDVQVKVPRNSESLRTYLPESTPSLIKIYPDLNHLFQHASTGLPDEYGEIEETISDEVLTDLTEWILTNFNP